MDGKKGVKKFVYKVGTAFKPLAEEGINVAAAYAGTIGVPSSITDLAKKTATGYMNDPGAYQSKKDRAKLLKQVGSVGLDAASPYLADAGIDVSQLKAAGKMAKDMRRASSSAPSSDSGFDMRGQAEDAFLSQLQSYMDQRAAKKSAPPPSTNPYDYLDQDGIIGNGLGYGLYAGSSGRGMPMRMWDRGKRYVNQGTSLIGGRGLQALESQPLDANF